MQLPQRDPTGRVPVRRLWPSSLREANPEAGAIVRVPSGLAVRMVLAGEAVPVFADGTVAPPSGPVVDVLRSSLRNDAELYGLMITARAYAVHGVGPERPAQRRANERLRNIIGGLPRTLCPASYTLDAFTKTFGPEPAGGWYATPEAMPFRGTDRTAELLAHHCRRRRFQVLMQLFDALRGGRVTASGQLPCGLSLEVPHEIWAATTVIVDVVTGAVTSDQYPLFASIEIAPPPAELAIAA